MPEPTKIPRAFAASGDKNSIPDSSGSPGFASWQEGFPAITSEPFAQGGIAPKRADFNGIFNALSLATLWQQQGGFYAYDNTTDYEVGNVVVYSGDLYKCLSANGPSSAVKSPTDATVWAKVILTTATTSAAGYMSAADKTKVDSVILTNATQSAAGYMSAADKTKLDGLISTNATQNAAGYMSAADKTKLDGLISTNATQSAAGYMSATDKTTLDGLDSSAVKKTSATQGTMTATSNITINYSGYSYANGTGSLLITLETSNTATTQSLWTDYPLFTISPAPKINVRGMLTSQTNSLSVSFWVDTDGVVTLSQKGVAFAGEWLWGGITFPIG